MSGSMRNNGSAWAAKTSMSRTGDWTLFFFCNQGTWGSGPTYQYLGTVAEALGLEIYAEVYSGELRHYSSGSGGEVAFSTGSSTAWQAVVLRRSGGDIDVLACVEGGTSWTLVASYAYGAGTLTDFAVFALWYGSGITSNGGVRKICLWHEDVADATLLAEMLDPNPVHTANLVYAGAVGANPTTFHVDASVGGVGDMTLTGTPVADGTYDPIPSTPPVRIMPRAIFRVTEWESPPQVPSGSSPLIAPAGNGVVEGASKLCPEFSQLIERWADGYAVLDAGLLEGKAGGYKFGLGSVTPNALNGPPVTDTGTPVAATYAPANVGQKHWRVRYPTTATAGTLGGWRANALFLSAGHSIGFFWRCRFVINEASAVSGARAFVGLTNSTSAPTNVDPASLTNVIGVARLSSDNTQLYLIAAGSSAQSGVALGTGFPPFSATADGTNGVPYEFLIYATSANAVYWALRRLDTMAMTSGQITTTAGTQRPAADTALGPRAWCTNNATAAVTAIETIDSSWLRLAA